MTLEALVANFHFLRPGWLWALLPAALLFALLRWQRRHSSNWEKAVDAELLPHLLDKPDARASRNPLLLALLAWALAALALAGPVWEKTARPIHERDDALVILFDLSRSMLATDVQPDRLVRAKRKLIDLLAQREEGVTALVAFAGDAHTVSPLTDDANTIKAMIPALAPDIMPAPGSRLGPALALALQLFEDGGAETGRILVITDEIRDLAAAQEAARQHRRRYPLSVLSVGTAEGAPVPYLVDGQLRGYLKNRAGELALARVDRAQLADFARLAGGRHAAMTLTDEDLAYLLASQPLLDDAYRELDREFDQWTEQGPWLLLLLLPLAALAFRRGWLWCLPLLLCFQAEEASAWGWDDLWASRDQQGMAALEAGEPRKAAELFESEAWEAAARYKGGDFEAAARAFERQGGAAGNYNLGNALARQGRFEEALEAYDAALALDPDFEDAKANRSVTEKALKERQERQQQGQGEKAEGEKVDGEAEPPQNAQKDEDGDKLVRDEDGDKFVEDEDGDKVLEDEEGNQLVEAQGGSESAEGVAADGEALDEEEKVALQQWLRRVPDDPGGLLKRKFQLQHQERLKQGQGAGNDAGADW